MTSKMNGTSGTALAAVAALLMAAGLGGPARAQSPRIPSSPNTASMPPGTPPPASSDQHLLKLSTQGNLAEVELGRLAITHSTNPAVLSLGTRLAQDGSKGVASLQTVAAMLHVQLPMSPSGTEEGQLAKLGKLKGAAFDKQFEQVARQDESRMLRKFRSGVASARNPAVQYTVKNMIPIVKEHLAIVQGGGTRMASASKSKAAMR